VHWARGLAAGGVKAQVLNLDRQVVRLVHPQVGARPAAGRAFEDDCTRRQRPRRLQARARQKWTACSDDGSPAAPACARNCSANASRPEISQFPAAPGCSFGPCLTSSSAMNTAPPRTGAGTGGSGPGAALAPPGTAGAHQIYGPLPELRRVRPRHTTTSPSRSGHILSTNCSGEPGHDHPVRQSGATSILLR